MLKILSKTFQIRQKLIIINLLTTGMALLITGSVLLLNVFGSFKDSLINNMTSQAKILANYSMAPLAFNDRKAASETLSALKTSPNIVCAIMYGKDGKVFAEYWRDGTKKNAIPIPPGKDRHLFADGHLHVFHSIELDSETIGNIYLRSNLKDMYSLMIKYGASTAITTIFVFGFAILLLTRLQKVITEPIFDLAESMQKVSRNKDYTHKANIFNDDEIGSLAKGFNEMLEHIQKRDLRLQVEITERKHAEEETRILNEELERKVEERTRQLLDTQEELVRKEKLATLGQLSGSVGHELRNPLGVMNNAIYYLKAITTDDDETLKEYLDIIKNEIDTSQRIISDLLDFSRTKSPQTKEITVRELLNESLGRCTIPKNVVLQTKLPDTLPSLRLDPLQIGQVLQNLITNAVQAMPDGGSLTLKCDDNLKDGTLKISVIDTGEGITPENMKKLFQPLFTTKARGIGLGLSVSRNLTEANGGTLEVTSRPGEGSTFEVILPIKVDT